MYIKNDYVRILYINNYENIVSGRVEILIPIILCSVKFEFSKYTTKGLLEKSLSLKDGDKGLPEIDLYTNWKFERDIYPIRVNQWLPNLKSSYRTSKWNVFKEFYFGKWFELMPGAGYSVEEVNHKMCVICGECFKLYREELCIHCIVNPFKAICKQNWWIKVLNFGGYDEC